MVTTQREVDLLYFASLKEQRGLGEETIMTTAETPDELYCELGKEYGFEIPKSSLRVAVNDEFRGWQTRLESGDTVVFIPPVSGG